MADLPERPFMTEDFSPAGAGIDFLGMRWVNLDILSRHLLPDVNNATNDFGVYCLAAWIPWKFKSLCREPKRFRYSNYLKFREAVEVGISYVTRPGSPASNAFGSVHRRIGADQKLDLPSKLKFDAAARTDATSIYAAPLYGPSLRYLGLIAGNAIATDGSSTGIPLASDDKDTMELINAIDEDVSGSRAARLIEEMDEHEFTGKELDELGAHGFHPARCRQFGKKVKVAFLTKLLPNDGENGRTLTAHLVIQTLTSLSGLDAHALRQVWHTGLLASDDPLDIQEAKLAKHRDRWAMLMVRQYQRYTIEYFMKCFESAVKNGYHSLDEITDDVVRSMLNLYGKRATLRDVFLAEAQKVSRSHDFVTIAERWGRIVDREHPSYVSAAVPEDGEDPNCVSGFIMLARWWFGSTAIVNAESESDLALLGGEDRMSMRWFFRWVERRLDQKLQAFVKDVFEQLVFAQHVRVALSRFDGRGQRLRFTLGDEGIIPTRSMAHKLTTGIPAWMADRLDAFVNLLTDLSVLTLNDDDGLEVGPLAPLVLGAVGKA